MSLHLKLLDPLIDEIEDGMYSPRFGWPPHCLKMVPSLVDHHRQSGGALARQGQSSRGR